MHGFQLLNKASKKEDGAPVTILCPDVVDKRAWMKEIKTYVRMFQRQGIKKYKTLASTAPQGMSRYVVEEVGEEEEEEKEVKEKENEKASFTGIPSFFSSSFSFVPP